MFKRIAALVTLVTMLITPTVMIDALDDLAASKLILSLDIQQHRFIKNSMPEISVEIDGKKYTQSVQINRDTTNVEMTFDVASYEPGTLIKVTGEHGLCGLQYYNYYAAAGIPFDVYTYVTPTEKGSSHQNIVNLTLDPLHYKDVDVFFNYKEVEFTEPAILCDDEFAFVPIIELAKHMGIDDAKYYPEYNCVRIAVGETSIVYYLDSSKIEINGEESTAPCDTKFVNSTIFAPLKPFSDLFESKITFADEGNKYNINLDSSLVLKKYNDYVFGKTYIVNEKGLSSSTDYLIWVSKSEFTVRVYQGSQGNWSFVTSFPCAIGAPGTPTCEGTYKYYQYQDRWAYANYYCGPIMRFNGGYAIHSTLIKYNGVPYDNRVGMRISHGCVRLRPENINWLASTIPLQTTIHISA